MVLVVARPICADTRKIFVAMVANPIATPNLSVGRTLHLTRKSVLSAFAVPSLDFVDRLPSFVPGRILMILFTQLVIPNMVAAEMLIDLVAEAVTVLRNERLDTTKAGLTHASVQK
jgi:hypothetical protein